jgi:four helix bundle protein
MRNYKDLQVWRRSHNLTIQIYKITYSFPKEELYSLTSQIRRASSSIPTNIAEGCGRGSEVDFARFLQISLGSAYETEYELLLAHELEYINKDDYYPLLKEISEIIKMLTRLIFFVKQSKETK